MEDKLATPVSWNTVHVKLPTEDFRGPNWGGYWKRRPTASNAWLDSHPNGFLLMRNLHHIEFFGKCMLVKSLDSNKLIVNKRHKRWAKDWIPGWNKHLTRASVPSFRAYQTEAPPELRISRRLADPLGLASPTLPSDPFVQVELPAEPYFPELYGYGIPGGNRSFIRQDGFTRDGTWDLFSLYFKWYNGRTLANLADMYSDPENGAPIPEPFIWHAIEQLCRAVIFLHTGLTRQDLKTMEWGRTGESIARRDWIPVVHRNICERNILLHFPEQGEKQDPLDCYFPQIILEGFSDASLLNDPEHLWSKKAPANFLQTTGEPLAPPACYEDIHMLGEVFRRLVAVHDTFKQNPEVGPDFNVDVEASMYEFRAENLKLPPGQQAAYSEDLLLLLMQWEVDELHEDGELFFTHETVRNKIPTIDFLIDIVLPTAASKVEEYRSQGLTTEDDDVSWVVPDPGFQMTPHYTNMATQRQAVSKLKRELEYVYGP
ncbi:hypothetical protein BT67DRAFT_375445, partial [Trichocladium antarcticum]